MIFFIYILEYLSGYIHLIFFLSLFMYLSQKRDLFCVIVPVIAVPGI